MTKCDIRISAQGSAAGTVLWRRRFPFWARVVLILLGLLGMALTLLSGMRLL